MFDKSGGEDGLELSRLSRGLCTTSSSPPAVLLEWTTAARFSGALLEEHPEDVEAQGIAITLGAPRLHVCFANFEALSRIPGAI